MSPDRTNAERQARHRAKQRKERAALEAELRALRNGSGQAKAGADVARLEAENAALARELAQAKARIAELEAANAALKAEIAAWAGAGRPLRTSLGAAKAAATEQRKAARAAAQAARLAAAAAERPDADVPTLLAEIEKRDRQTKALRTEVRNLRAQVHHMEEHFRDGAGSMNFATQGAIAKCLHPDQRHNATEADKDKAFKAFTAWKADNDKARREG